MRSLSCIYTIQCTLVLLLALHVLTLVNAAPCDTQIRTARNDNRSKNELTYAVRPRQANEEDSDEDSNEDDAEQVQQSLIEQQNQQNLENSQEGGDEEGNGDDIDADVRYRRHRRDTKAQEELDKKVEVQPETTYIIETSDKDKDKTQHQQQEPNPTIQPSVITEATTNSPSFNRTSVLILIRDTLKKVTTVLPAEKVATNALQYFQLFEHFLQQTIEQVIDDYDDDDEESTTTIKIDEVSFSPVKDDNVTNTETSSDSKDIEAIESINNKGTENPQQTSVESNSTKSPAIDTNTT